jgi:hypothetical protein
MKAKEIVAYIVFIAGGVTAKYLPVNRTTSNIIYIIITGLAVGLFFWKRKQKAEKTDAEKIDKLPLIKPSDQ